MSLNEKTSSERVHIGFFGLRNAGKSSVVNAVTNQNLALVSEIKGTTTDPVQKAMEILPLGPVVIIDTPGLDDEGALGEMRVKKALQVINKTDVGVLVVDSTVGIQPKDNEIIGRLKEHNIPYIIVYNKCDLLSSLPASKDNEIYVSATNKTNINELRELIAKFARSEENTKKLIGDLLHPNDVVILVTPIDESAPKGRLILPQQQVIRDILDANAINLVVKETELEQAILSLKSKPKMVITDSQAFGVVNKIVPKDILLTSFSIIFARYKGDLKQLVNGARTLDSLQDGDKVLISEGCTHHRQCGDIGTVKLPNWINKYCNKKLTFDFTSGGEFKEDLSKYKLVIHCGGCMLNEKEMKSRISHSVSSNVPITNYGTAIAHINGILERSLEPFKNQL